MKKFLLLSFILIVVTCFFANKTLALQPDNDTILQQSAKQSGFNTAGVTATSLSESVGKYIKVVLSLVGTIFLVLTIYAGILWMTASGSEDQVSKSISILRSAVIGLVIITSAYSLTAFVVLSNTTANSSTTDQAPCDMGDWNYNATSAGVGCTTNEDGSQDCAGNDKINTQMSGVWNKSVYSSMCAVKGVFKTTLGGICSLGNIFCAGQCDMASACTSWMGN